MIDSVVVGRVAYVASFLVFAERARTRKYANSVGGWNGP